MMNDNEIPKPNMTPMIDVVFQLLVFFLIIDDDAHLVLEQQ